MWSSGLHFILSFLLLQVADPVAPSVVQHLRWIMQKDLLGQDVFLIGPPGPLRRSIAMQYLVSRPPSPFLGVFAALSEL